METNLTNEFSFILKPGIHGVGVFSTHDIKMGTPLRLFGDNNPRRLLNKEEVPQEFWNFCADRGDKMICPPDFGYMPIGWYLNHSSTPNVAPLGGYQQDGYHFYAIRDINSGEEITIDYNTLEEPEESKSDFYKIKS